MVEANTIEWGVLERSFNILGADEYEIAYI